jgi:hypothetical protein
MISKLVRGSILALLSIACVPTIASARTPFDGDWSVLIVTQRGACDPSYRYGVQIINGYLVYQGGAVNMSGRVASNGNIHVVVSSGNAQANGSGRLSRTTGRGNWVGRSGADACSGYWQAERRG